MVVANLIIAVLLLFLSYNFNKNESTEVPNAQRFRQ